MERDREAGRVRVRGEERGMKRELEQKLFYLPWSKSSREECDIGDDINRVLGPFETYYYRILSPIKKNLKNK